MQSHADFITLKATHVAGALRFWRQFLFQTRMANLTTTDVVLTTVDSTTFWQEASVETNVTTKNVAGTAKNDPPDRNHLTTVEYVTMGVYLTATGEGKLTNAGSEIEETF